MERPVPIMPTVKQTQAISEDLCIFFSTSLPIKAADIPKKKMAREKAQPTEKELIPICSAMVALNVDQQYTEPIEQCNNKAGIAARIHLFSNIIYKNSFYFVLMRRIAQ